MSDPTTTFAGETTASDAEERPSVGDCVGRYVLLSELGAGGMGTVYEALDPELDRRVAIKVLHSRYAGPGHAARLVREGQALARISHANVVQVFEVGHYRDTVYIVMELVKGESLATWLDAERLWPDIVRAFVAAGKGLAAAHAEGLVHRDFKPGNVVVGEGGEVKVLDFGLARALGESSSSSAGATELESTSTAGNASGLLHTKLTRDGTVLGTPPYMALEQFRGDKVDHRADQHAFCVSLYEALYGRRPFVADSWKELRKNIAKGAIGARPKSSAPRGLFSIVRRGVRPEPERRFASMDAVVHALRAELPGGRRRPYRTAATGVVAFAGIAVWFGAFGDPSTPCENAADMLAGVWDEARREAAISGFGNSGASFGADARDKVIGHLDQYADGWTEQRAEVCEALRAGDGDDDHLLDRRMRCLGDSARQLAALAHVLATPDAQTVERAVAAAKELPPLSRCRDASTLLATVALPKDPIVAKRIDELRAALADIRGLQTAGRSDDARERVTTIVADAEEIGYAPLVASALRIQGDLAADVGDYPAAAESTEAAYWVAEEAGDDRDTAACAVRLASIVCDRLGKQDEGETWLRHAEGAIVRLEDSGADARDLRASLAVTSGTVLFGAGKLAEALEELQRGRALYVASKGEDDLEVAATDLTMGSVLAGLGRFDEGLETLERVRASYTETFGDGHPRLALLHGAIANLHRMSGDADSASEHVHIGLRIVTEAYGEGHPMAAKLYFNLGGAEELRGNLDAAAKAYRRAGELAALDTEGGAALAAFSAAALAGIERLRGNNDAARLGFEEAARMFELEGKRAQLGTALTNLAGVYSTLGRTDDALTTLTRAETLVAETRGAEHPSVAEARAQRGRVLIDAGRPDEATVILDDALKLATQSLGDDNELVVFIRREAANAYYDAKQLDQALAHAERAVADSPTAKVGPLYEAAGRLVLARVHAARGETEQAEAVALAAVAQLEGNDDPAAQGVREKLQTVLDELG